MHDVSYANKIVAALVAQGVPKGAAGRAVVKVSLSPFSHVKPERLKETARVIAGSEGYQNMALEVRTASFTISCSSCGRESEHREAVFSCPHCGSTSFNLKPYEEFCIDSVENKEG